MGSVARRLLRVTVVILCCLVAAACNPLAKPTETPEPTSTPIGALIETTVLRVGTPYIWDTANPTAGWYNRPLRTLLFDALVQEAGISRYVPGLAESWSVSKDGREWTFTIREGVTFHDGTPCTAEDIAWSLNWTRESGFETLSPHVEGLDEIVALGPSTLLITLPEPLSDMEYRLSQVWILPRSVWEGVTAEDDFEVDGLDAAIGTGPYRLVEAIEGDYLILDVNEDYWRRTPAIERVVYQEFSSEEAMVQALLDGDIDVIDDVPWEAVSVLEEAASVEVAVLATTRIDELIINSFKKGTQPASLNEAPVRLAIAHALDERRVVEAAHQGYAELGTTVVPRSMGDWHNTGVWDIPFDLREANLVLDRAGYVDSDDDGIREDSKGRPLEYRLYAEDGEAERLILEGFSDSLAQIGISTSPTFMSENNLYGLYPDYDFDLIYWGWELEPDPGFAMSIFTCDQREEDGWNDSGYCDEEFEELYQRQASTVDPEARRELILVMQEKLFDERPYIVLTYAQDVQAYRSDRFTGFDLEAPSILWKSSLLPARPRAY